MSTFELPVLHSPLDTLVFSVLGFVKLHREQLFFSRNRVPDFVGLIDVCEGRDKNVFSNCFKLFFFLPKSMQGGTIWSKMLLFVSAFRIRSISAIDKEPGQHVSRAGATRPAPLCFSSCLSFPDEKHLEIVKNLIRQEQEAGWCSSLCFSSFPEETNIRILISTG